MNIAGDAVALSWMLTRRIAIGESPGATCPLSVVKATV